MIDLSELTIKKTRKSLDNGEFTARELAEEFLSVIKTENKEINAYLEVYDDILEQVERADQMIKTGQATNLTGIPMAIKDNILIKGKKASSASKILEGYVAPYNATVIEKLKKEGVVFIGRTNMDEFAMGGSTENSAFGVTKNPVDRSRVPGGSSGGSAAAVAMGSALASLGSDTAGSIREPASFCGLVGLKPTYGRVSRYGLMALGSSLDCIGPFTKTVEDSEIVFNAIKGQDKFDSTTVAEATEFPISSSAQAGKSQFPIKIGIPYHVIKKVGMSDEALNTFEQSVNRLKKLGYQIKEIELPNMEYSIAVYYIILPAEVSSNLARFDGVKYGLHVDGENLLDDYLKTRKQGFGKEVQRRILIGTYVLSAGYHDAYYGKALLLRQKISDEFKSAFKEVDVIVTPTTLGPAFKIGEKTTDPLSMYFEDVFTVPANIAGIPALSIPGGFVQSENRQLPIGLQIMAPHNQEDLLFEIGKRFEREM